MTQTEREMRAEFEGAFRAHWRPEMSIGANSLNVAKIFAWSMWQAAAALAKHEGAQAGWQLVPNEPTPEMIEATSEAFKQLNDWAVEMQSVRGRVWTGDPNDPPINKAWRAMLAASPLYTAAPDKRDAVDAARYRWLRDATRMVDGSVDGMLTIHVIHDDAAPSEIRDDLDSAIDAARSTTNG